jgi:predicted dehydrogenase
MTPIGLGIIGVGGIVRTAHMPSLAYLEEFDLRGVCSSKPETTKAAAARYRARGFARSEDLLAQSDIQAVLIATPSALHEPLIRASLTAGKHVFCETPARMNNRAATEELMAAAKQRNLVVQVGHCFRYSPLVDLLREHLAEASAPRLWTYEYFPYIGHIYDLAMYLSGPVDRVLASHSDASGVTTTLRFRGGDTAVIIGRSINNCGLDIECIRVSSTDFYGQIDGRRTVRVARMPSPVPVPEWSTRRSPAVTYAAQAGGRTTLEVTGYIAQLRGFAESITRGTAPRCTLHDTQATGDLLGAIAAAAT